MASSAKNNAGLTISEQVRSDWPALVLVLATLVAGFFLYPHLPERVPSHWNLQGEVDGYSSRFWGAFGLPLLNAAIYLLMLVTPLIDPRKENYRKFAGSYHTLKIALILVLTGLYMLVAASALGYQLSMDKLVPLIISLLFILIGNMMGKFRHNYFVGIKVPWTLASETVWQKTHRLAAPLWVGAGMLGVAGSLAGGEWAAALLLIPLSAAVIIPIIYSLMVYNKLNKNK